MIVHFWCDVNIPFETDDLDGWIETQIDLVQSDEFGAKVLGIDVYPNQASDIIDSVTTLDEWFIKNQHHQLQ